MLKKWIARGDGAAHAGGAGAGGKRRGRRACRRASRNWRRKTPSCGELLSQEESARLLAARFNGGVVTVSEAKAEYDYQAYYYEQLGMDPDDHEDTIKNEVLSNLTEDAILTLKAQELGVYAPSAEEEAEIHQRAQASLDEMVDYYLAYQSDPDKSDEENRAAVLEFLAGEGTTLESLIESMTAQGWRDRLFEAVTGEMTISEDELRAYYDEACASAEMTYTADPQSYENDRLSGVSVFWNPQGYRRVKRVLIPFSAENAARMQELTAQIERRRRSRDQRRRRRDGRHLRLPGRHCAGSAVRASPPARTSTPSSTPMAPIPIWPRAAPAGKRATTSASAASCSTRTSSPRPWR